MWPGPVVDLWFLTFTINRNCDTEFTHGDEPMGDRALVPTQQTSVLSMCSGNASFSALAVPSCLPEMLSVLYRG